MRSTLPDSAWLGRLAAPRAAAFGLLLLAVALSTGDRAAADRLAPDPVEEFKQALKQEKDPIKDKGALAFRKTTLARKAEALTSLGDIGRVLLLQEWRADATDEAVGEIDREVRDALADRFVTGVKAVVASGSPDQRAAAANLVAETAASARTLGFKTRFLRLRLAGLAPEMVKLTGESDLLVRESGATALGGIQADPKVAVKALSALLAADAPELRRAAADALGNVIQVVAKQEKQTRGIDAGRIELRNDLLTSSLLVTPAAAAGLTPEQPVFVRRLSADAWQQITTGLLELTPEAIKAEDLPPPGRAWTADEAERIKAMRDAVKADREELRPLMEAFAKQSAAMAKAASDPDPVVRVIIRRVLEDLAIARSRILRRENSIPAEPRTEPKSETKPDGAFLPDLPNSPVPTRLVSRLADEKADKAPAAKPDVDLLADALRPSLPAMIAGLNDPNMRARLAAIDVLESMSTEAVPAIPALVKTLQTDTNRFVRWAAVRTLGKLAPRRAELVVPAAAPLLNVSDLDERIAVAAALERFGPEARAAVPTLQARVTTGDPEGRIAMMKTLEAIGTDAAPAIPAIARNLVADNNRVRAFAAEALGRFGKLAAATEPALRQAMTDGDADVRRAASEAVLKVTVK